MSRLFHHEHKVPVYIDMARSVSKLSKDAETKVGALLIHKTTGAILATGYNGFIRGADDDMLPSTRPFKYTYMQHAERNLIYNCAKHGVSMNDCVVVCTLSPCTDCVRAMWQCGIDTVYVKDLYSEIDKTLSMKDLGVVKFHIKIGDDNYYRLDLGVESNVVPLQGA